MFEREGIIGAILFAMGLQNSLVSNISGGLIKTTHLTGLFTDLGSELAELAHPRSEKSKTIKHKVLVRITILAFYLFGGIAGGYFFDLYNFRVFFAMPCILLTILYYDISPIALRKLSRIIYTPSKH